MNLLSKVLADDTLPAYLKRQIERGKESIVEVDNELHLPAIMADGVTPYKIGFYYDHKDHLIIRGILS